MSGDNPDMAANATPAQEATYYSIMASMHEGFAGTFNQLDTYLTKIQK